LPGDATAPSGHLAPYSGISVIGEAGTGDDDVTEARRLRPAVAIIDFQLPTMSGIEATKLIKLESPSTAVIGLTAGVPDDTEWQCSTSARWPFSIKQAYSKLFIQQS